MHIFIKSIFLTLFIFVSTSPVSLLAQNNPLTGKHILVFSKTAGFRHASIPDGQKALLLMGRQILSEDANTRGSILSLIIIAPIRRAWENSMPNLAKK